MQLLPKYYGPLGDLLRGVHRVQSAGGHANTSAPSLLPSCLEGAKAPWKIWSLPINDAHVSHGKIGLMKNIKRVMKLNFLLGATNLDKFFSSIMSLPIWFLGHVLSWSLLMVPWLQAAISPLLDSSRWRQIATQNISKLIVRDFSSRIWSHLNYMQYHIYFGFGIF